MCVATKGPVSMTTVFPKAGKVFFFFHILAELLCSYDGVEHADQQTSWRCNGSRKAR